MNLKKTIAFSLIGSVVLMGGISYSSSLSDLNGHWGEHSVDMLVERGIIDGYPEGVFKPEKNITRGEVSKVISEYIGDRKLSRASLADIEGIWCTDFIKHLIATNIVNGYPDGTFRPNKDVTRGEFSNMIYKYLSEREGGIAGGSNKSFKDIKGHWAEESIAAIASEGYVSGYSDGTFKPNEPITRVEVASVIANIIKKDKHEENMDFFIEQLGFKSDRSGDWDGVESLKNPVSVYRDNPNEYEVCIVLRDWANEEVEESWKIPEVFDELLKVYFGSEAEYAYDKMDDTEVTEFEASDRFIRIKDKDGCVYIYIGYEGKEKFEKQ